MRAGINDETSRRWAIAHPAWREALNWAQSCGVSLYEGALETIALDYSRRDQVRALELVLKSRAPEYRDKHQHELTIRAAFGEAGAAIAAAYTAPQTPELT